MSVSRNHLYVVALIGAIACLVAGQAWAGGSEDFAELAKKWQEAYNAGDAAAVAALYTEDGIAMPPNAEAVKGREAIITFLKEDMMTIPAKLEIKTVEHSISGELGYAQGTFVIIDAEGNTVDQGKWMDVRKMVDGKWYIQNDIWNSDLPLPSGD